MVFHVCVFVLGLPVLVRAAAPREIIQALDHVYCVIRLRSDNFGTGTLLESVDDVVACPQGYGIRCHHMTVRCINEHNHWQPLSKKLSVIVQGAPLHS